MNKLNKSIITYKFRIKDSSCKKDLERKASAVNFVWNYCNNISRQSANKRSAGSWIREFDLNRLTSGSSKELGLNAQTIQAICQEFCAKRDKFRRPKLKWRSAKRSLGWIPFKKCNITLKGDTFKYLGKQYRFWKSREIEGDIKCGSINQDSRGNWFINIACEVENRDQTQSDKVIGIDLGLKTLATCSDGTVIDNNRVTAKYADKLAMAQRARKKKQVTNIQAKIKNVRKDFLQKESTKLVNRFKKIFIGDVSSTQLVKTRMAKSVLDAGWGLFKEMLKYKAIRLGVDFQITNERYSSVTCSGCNARSGPSGLSGLGIRDWECSECGSKHDRDVNAARNILNFALGYQSPIREFCA